MTVQQGFEYVNKDGTLTPAGYALIEALEREVAELKARIEALEA